MNTAEYKQITMTDEEWEEQFRPIKNHLATHGAGNGCGFETYGEEIEFVRQFADKNRVWTVIEGDDGSAWICEGMRLVNRLWFFVTEEPYDPNTTYDICYWESMDADREDCLECGDLFEETGKTNIDGEGFCQTCRVELELDEEE